MKAIMPAELATCSILLSSGPAMELHWHDAKQIYPLPASISFFFFSMRHTLSTKTATISFSLLCNMLLHLPSAEIYSLPLEPGLFLLLALTGKMWQKESGIVLGLALRVSAFSLEEDNYHERSLAALNSDAMRKQKLASHLVETWGIQLSLNRELKHSTPVKLCKLVSSHSNSPKEQQR